MPNLFKPSKTPSQLQAETSGSLRDLTTELKKFNPNGVLKNTVATMLEIIASHQRHSVKQLPKASPQTTEQCSLSPR